jgi:hypothetical protein
MTVRTWITLSLFLLVAMTVAVFVRFLAPVGAPPVLARVGEVRVEGALDEACWPQRGGELRCTEGDDGPRADATLPDEGKLRLIVAYPAQPEGGRIDIRRDGESVLRTDWEDEIAYELEPGTYTMIADATYPQDAFVRYRFAFRIR